MKSFPRVRTSRGLLAMLPSGLVLGMSVASAATLQWDPGATPATPSGGIGTWNAANTNWSNGASDVAFANNDIAIFAGSAGTVTLDAARTANGVQFDTDGYTLSGANDLTVNAVATGDDTFVVGGGVNSVTLGLRKLIFTASGSGAIGDAINTDKVDFGSTIVTFSGSRQVAFTNSSATATTSITNFAGANGTGNGANTSVHVNQGHLSISNLSAGAGTSALSAINSANNYDLSIRGTGAGTVTLNGNNTLLNNTGAGGFTVSMQSATLTLALGHDNALGAKDGANAATDTSFVFNNGTVVASGGARNIANNVTLGGNGTLGGANAITFSGSFTNSGGNRTLTVSNNGQTTLSGPVFLANDNATSRTLTITGAEDLEISGNIANNNAGNTTASGLTKSGDGTLTLSGAGSTYTGNTLVSGGTLFVAGSLGNTAVTVGSAGAIAGGGTIGGSLAFADGAKLTIDLSDILSVTGQVSFANFGFDDLVGFDVETATLGTHVLLGGDNIDFTNVEHFGLANAFIRGDGSKAYFEAGSLAVTIVAVPEPGALALTALGGFALLRRRRR